MRFTPSAWLSVYANAVSGVSVTFSAPPLSGASGSFAGGLNTATTNANGLATSAALTANTKSGSYNISASASLTGAVNFSETNIAGSPVKVVITPTPSTAMASSTTNITLGLQLVDQYGNNTTSSGTTTLRLGSSSTAGFFTSSLGASGTMGATLNVSFTGTGTANAYYGDEFAADPIITATDPSIVWQCTSACYDAVTDTFLYCTYSFI